jgi:nucleoside-diphosphate-sugar epimerase
MAKRGILITGGSGLVGAYAVNMLLERGERPVVFDVALNERLLNAVGVDTSKVTLIRGDMADMPAIISAIRDNDCDRIIHLAAFLGEEVQRRPYSGVRLNFMGTINVFEAARLEKVERVIFPSSGTVYLGSLGEGVKQIDESIPMNPPSVYAATKASCEFMGRAYAKRYGFEFICLRYTGGLYGPSPAALKATREIAIQQMIRAAVKGESAKVSWPYGPAEILYGKDAAKGTVLAVMKDKFKDTLFHIGNAAVKTSSRPFARNFPARTSRSSKLPAPCHIPNRACPAISPVPRNSLVMSLIIRSTKRSRTMGRRSRSLKTSRSRI